MSKIKQTKDLLFDIKISVNASYGYVDKLKSMNKNEFKEHVLNSCFKNNNRFLVNAEILNNGFQPNLDKFKNVFKKEVK